MKFRFLCLISFIIPILPYFAPNGWLDISFRLINLFSFVGCIILFLLAVIFLIFSCFKLFSIDSDQELITVLKPPIKRIFQISLITILSLISYTKIDNAIEFWQIRKIERIVESNNLYEKGFSQLPEKLKNHNRKHKWFTINYSEIMPESNQGLAEIYYRKDLLFEDWDCHLFYSRQKPDGPPYRIIRKGKNQYNWYKWCNY